MNHKGQTLVEFILFFFLFVLVLTAMVSFTKYILMREKMIAAVREGALLYSSGHVPANVVKTKMAEAMAQGWPVVHVNPSTIFVGRYDGNVIYRFDRVAVRYRPDAVIGKFFAKELEESCVVKHAPRYGPPLTDYYGPGVNW